MFTCSRLYLRLFSILPLNASSAVYMHTSDYYCGHWYTAIMRNKAPKLPRKNPPHFNFDWEHERFVASPPNDFIPEANCVEDVQKLPDEFKKLFMWDLNSKQNNYEYQIERLMESLSLHPADESLTARAAKMTLKIRYNKAILDKYPRINGLRSSTESLIQRRMRILRRLRVLNMPDFEKLVTNLRIPKFIHLDPFDLPNSTETDIRKGVVRKECYQRRLAKLAKLKQAFAAEKQAFFPKKRQELDRLLSILMRLEEGACSPTDLGERARRRLEDLFSEVIAERKLQLQAPIRSSNLSWYIKEDRQRREYALKEAEKEARQLKQRKRL